MSLSSHPLFAESIANQRQHLRLIELEIMAARQSDDMSQVIAVRPFTVILDDGYQGRYLKPNRHPH